MTELPADELQAFVDFPLVLVLILLGFIIYFRKELPALLLRLKAVKVAPTGFEAEFYEDLRKLPEQAERAAEEASPAPQSHPLTGSATNLFGGPAPQLSDAVPPSITSVERAPDASERPVEESKEPSTDSVAKLVQTEADTDPQFAMMRLSIEIERELFKILASAGFLAGRDVMSFGEMIRTIKEQYRIISPSLVDALETFYRVRNEIAHANQTDADDLQRVLDSGVVIYRTLRFIPRAKHVVHQTDVALYSNAAGTEEIREAKGVLINEVSPGEIMKHRQVFPTTRTHFRKGMQVAWEFDDQRVWGETWYRDPDTDDIRYAWTESFEFAGRSVEEFSKRA